VIVWFLALAFLDDAFDGRITSPADLLNMHNLGPGEKRIYFKRDKLQIPIFRRMRSTGSIELSPNLPWSCSSVTNESQRVVREAGFPQRYTFYNVRRTMGNMLEDSKFFYPVGLHGASNYIPGKVPAARRKKLMGHSGESDTVFRKYYESKHMVVDTGNIFRKEKPRPEKTEVLSMHLRRDPHVPDLPDSLLIQTLDDDEEVQRLAKARRELQDQLYQIKGDVEQGYNEVTMSAALECVRRALNNRRRFLKNHAKEDFRKKYFENPESIRTEYPSARPPERHYRSELVGALYPGRESEGSALVAIEAVIAHCRSKTVGQKKGYHRLPQLEDSSTPTSSEADQDTRAPVKRKLTAQRVQRLVHLKRYEGRRWAEISAEFPGWSKRTLEYRYGKAISSSRPDTGLEAEEESLGAAGGGCPALTPDSSDCPTKHHWPGSFQQQNNPKKRSHSLSSASDATSPAEHSKRVCGHHRPGSPGVIIARAVYNVETGTEEWVDV
jgi:hypothetical protein